MIRVLWLALIVIISLVCVTYYQNPSVFKSLYAQKLANPKTWGKIEVVEEKPIGSIKDIFQSVLLWQLLEQLVAFVTGVVICVLIGWRVGSYRSIYEKSFENSLSECQRRQGRFEKRLEALELQIVYFERSYLFHHKDTALGSESGIDTSTPTEGRTHVTEEEDKRDSAQTVDKQNQTDKDEGLVRQAVEVIMKQDFDEENFERILEKLTKILERLSNLGKEKMISDLKSEDSLVQEQEAEVDARPEEYYAKDNIEKERGNENEDQNMICSGKEDKTAQIDYSNVFCENTSNDYHEKTPYDRCESTSHDFCEKTPLDCHEQETTSYELHRCKSIENISEVMVSIVGAGECEETYRGKIVPVSQIPRVKKQRVKTLMAIDDERSVPRVTGRITPEQSISEGSTPLTTPRTSGYNSSPSPSARAASRGGRRKLRS